MGMEWYAWISQAMQNSIFSPVDSSFFQGYSDIRIKDLHVRVPLEELMHKVLGQLRNHDEVVPKVKDVQH
jgi:hypothetical protein